MTTRAPSAFLRAKVRVVDLAADALVESLCLATDVAERVGPPVLRWLRRWGLT